MPPTIVTNVDIRRPYAKRSPATDDAVDSVNLPFGVELTGGKALREKGLTGKGVRVAVIDSGVDETHEEFNGCVKQQVWFRSGTSLETDDHGTHVAGTIHFMAPDAEIYDYRVFGEEGGFGVTDAIVTSIFEAVYDECDVINMSLGGRWPSPDIRAAVQFAHSKGIFVVCASGNEGDGSPLTNERSFPAMWDEGISVAAIGKEKGLPVAYFSNTNPAVDFAGIGVDVVSLKPFGGFQKMSGTSMAAPHVAGFIAALLSDNNKKKRFKSANDFHDELLEQYVIDIGVKGPDRATGLGFLSYLSEQEVKKLLGRL